MPVPPNITQTAGDNQHVENHHRYDCEWNQVLHTYLLSGFDNLVIFPAQPSLFFCFVKIACSKKQLFFDAMHVYEVRAASIVWSVRTLGLEGRAVASDLAKLHGWRQATGLFGRGVAALAPLPFHQGRNITLVRPSEL